MSDIEAKQEQFNRAMELFEKKKIYRLTGRLVSVSNVSLQIYSLYLVMRLSVGIKYQILALIAAYFITDFLNGLVHLYADNNDDYESLFGPFIAAFHLHHRTPQYKHNNVFVVYFNETGSKLWLVIYLSAIVFLLKFSGINQIILFMLVYTGVLSSGAEVSHFLAHNHPTGFVNRIRALGLLLSPRHHARHHLDNNVSYAFLNAWTDPPIDALAKRLYKGYKKTTDLHYALYTGSGTENR